jgi:hypothetical protein
MAVMVMVAGMMRFGLVVVMVMMAGERRHT